MFDELSTQNDLSKTALIRQALRLYQLVDARISRGEKLFFEDLEKQKAELIYGIVIGEPREGSSP